MSIETIEPTPITEPLDTFLRDVVQSLQAAVRQGIQATQDDPPAADRVIQDCKEILDTIMAGQITEWLGEPSG